MSNDTRLQQAVLSELNWEPSVKSAHIGVTANNGVVTLSGHVDSFVEKYAAETAARRVKGVKAVAEEIAVHLPFDMKREDDDIAAAAIERLAWDASVPHDAVNVKVENGWVTLTGQIDWHYQKEAVEREIRGLLGVTGVSDQMTIKPTVNTLDIDANIMRALDRSWFFEPKTITVSAEGGTVSLKGTVRSWHDRDVATMAAWAAPGVTAVQNDIAIV